MEQQDTNTDMNEQLNSRIKTLNSAMIAAAEEHIEQRKPIDRNFELSEAMNKLFKERINYIKVVKN